MFTLTERLTIDTANSNAFATIDLGSYVDVGDRQALQVHSVDFIFQGTTASESIPVAMGYNAPPAVAIAGTVFVQVTDLNRKALFFLMTDP